MSMEWMRKYLSGDKVRPVSHDDVLALRDHLSKWSQAGDSVDRFTSPFSTDGYKVASL